jgi:lysine-specific demethylase/histidyl-hydroxylase NO66
MFEGLIDPIAVDEFVDAYWEKQLLYLDRKGERDFDEIISVDDIDDFLSRTDIRHPSLRLVQDGTEIPLQDYTRELKLGAHVSHDLIDNERMLPRFHQGATHGNRFVTPAGSQGFTSHYDTYSFFVLRLEGTKLWRCNRFLHPQASSASETRCLINFR